MLLKALLLFIVGFASLVVALVILARDIKRIANLAFFGISFFAGLWTIGIGGFLLANDVGVATWWAKLYYCAPLLLVASALVFCNVFPTNARLRFNASILLTIPLLFLVGVVIFKDGFLIQGIVQHDWGMEVVLNRPAYFLYSLYLIVSFVVSLWSMYLKSHTEKGIYRVQASLVFRGLGVASAIGVFFNLVLPWFGNYQLIWIGPLATNIFIFTNAYGIVRHRMFDLHFYAVRATAYLFTLLLLSIVYIAPALYVMGIIIMDFPFVWSKFILGVAFATVAAVNYDRIKVWFDKNTERIFFRDAYDSTDLISKLNRILVSTMDLRVLLRNSASHISSSMKADYCSFVLNEATVYAHRFVGTTAKQPAEKDFIKIRHLLSSMNSDIFVADHLEEDAQQLKALMTANSIAVIIRLANKTNASVGDDLGYVILGFKKSGNSYNNKDRMTLESIADVLTIAIQNALHFEEIQNFNMTLQQTVDQKTLQLRRSNAKLVALDETKDDFISMASHQLRTPLTSVKGYLSMVLEGDAGKINPMQRKMLAQAFMSSQHMVYLIADLLNVSRLKNGKFVIEPAAINLAAMIQEEIGQLRETAKSRGLTLEYEKPKDFPSLMLDETKTRQVVMNFIDNAIHYTQSGGTVRVELYDKPQTVELRVVDTGIGVPKNEQPHLFTKFYRAGNARRERPDGTGLGLFMAKKVVVAQGGAILFDSKEGKGSTFGFSLSKSKLAVPAVVSK